ncbi:MULTISPECIES: hypothetical protein [Catenuloplanes]|uniref:Uncharacterized protein n=1 Tax=Catenuloplanes niger TaxID=587534 RepID=A0AAE3ZL03_9ACTN|nr:hypothetical protein [Catenuloplanes niger]MDR7320837.1 hypothetical protein [Catenuloplanes niger]
MSAPERPLVRGEILQLACQDYKFGTLDPLRLQIGTVGGEHHLDDGVWIEVVGVVLADDGSPVRPRPTTLIRAAAINRARQAEQTGVAAARRAHRRTGPAPE